MKKLVAVLAASLMWIAVPASARIQSQHITWNPDLNGRDYHFSQLPYPAWIGIGAYADPGDAAFIVRILRIGQSGAVFHQTSAFQQQCGCQAVTGLFGPPTPEVGGYIVYIDATWANHSNKVVAAFVVT